DRYWVGRVIARPYVGKPGAFRRTYNRKDFSMQPTGPLVLDSLAKAGVPVVAIGKIEEIYAGGGISRSVHTEGNADSVVKIREELAASPRGLLFANLVDF